MTAESSVSDLLYGLEAIGSYLRMTPRQAKHRALSGQLPTFKMGRNTCARRSTLNTWLAEQEAAARRVPA